MDRNTNEDSKTSDGDGGAAAGSGGDHGGRSEDGNGTDRPRRRRSGDALRLQEALLIRRDGLLGGSSASLDALDASPRGDQQRRRRVRSRHASENLLTMASDAALGREGERGLQDADGQQAGDSTAAVGLGQQRRGGEAEQSGRSGELPPPRLASIFSGSGDGSGRQEPLDRDQMAAILSAALAVSAGEFGYDEEQVEGVPERTPRNYFDDDKRLPQ